MAINRDIINWDLVFESKRYDQILNMLITNYTAIYGSDINLNVNTADGEYIRMLAGMLFKFSELANDVYNSFDINSAKGALLDNLVLLSGNLVRKSAAKTKLQCTLSWVGSDIIYDAANDVIVVQDNLNKLWRVTPIPNISGIIAFAGTTVYLEAVQKGDFIPEDPILEIRKNGSFENDDTISLTNIIIEQRGSVNESDALLRARKKETLSYNSTSLIDSIREQVLNNVYSVQDIKIYNSNMDMSEGAGVAGIDITIYNGTDAIVHRIPLHDVLVIVKPQESVTIVQDGIISQALVDVLRKKITLGISTFQTNILLIDDITNDINYHEVDLLVNEQFPGYSEKYRYYIAQQYKPAIEVQIASTSAAYNAATTLERIRKALYSLALGYPINKNLNKTEIMNAAYNAGNIDPNNPTFTIDDIVITGGTAVNNGYWYVDGIADVKITVTGT